MSVYRESYYRERELKNKIKTHELQIAKHRRRIEVAQDKITASENELEEIKKAEESLKNLEGEWYGCTWKDF